ncbi:HET-domain-containing protein [Fusarium austroafricanum]|uniref:HET-domain-containing protein n=1 Tax=Fusarium austroafricanum TaxID=2364996 RepID=A0A8H4K0Z4_9HYPO|nr:HET-domain-containing protein [Fusarium austroafricanum]
MANYASHDTNMCTICSQFQNRSYQTFDLAMDSITGVAGSGCPIANLIQKACTVRRGPDAPSDTNDISFMVSAGGNMPVRCSGIELYSTQSADDKFGIGRLQHISGFPTDEACINLIKSWVYTCNNDHRTATCLPEHLPPLPRRILDVGSPETDPRSAIRLCETKEAPGSYIALSHCWGNLEEQHRCQTQKDNITQRLNSIEWSELPKTFQDSVTITRALGIRYLWIDSLCIIQGDVEDWERESKSMARIYQDSYVTIAAAVGQSDSDGFIKEREKDYRPHEVARGIYWRQEVGHVVHNRWEPLARRAWRFQERLVPRRVLTFHRAEVTFECRLAHWCECGRNETYGKSPDRIAYERMLLKGTRPEEELVDYWHSTIIRDYTRLSLSYERDRLPALSAIASQIHAKTGGRCVAGIWENQVLDGLLWRCLGRAGFNKDSKWQIFLPMAMQHGQCKAPSWSWASVEGPITPASPYVRG